jgi:hypothetical protein
MQLACVGGMPVVHYGGEGDPVGTGEIFDDIEDADLPTLVKRVGEERGEDQYVHGLFRAADTGVEVQINDTE